LETQVLVVTEDLGELVLVDLVVRLWDLTVAVLVELQEMQEG
jgi:hypothetical protein